MSSVVDDSQISLILCRGPHIAGIQLAVSCIEPYFSCYCALKRTGTFALENKVKLKLMPLFKLTMFNVSFSWNQTVPLINLKLRRVCRGKGCCFSSW